MFDFYIGVDQTGAVKNTRHGPCYKPLPAAIVHRRDQGVLELKVAASHGTAISLTEFTPAAIGDLLTANKFEGSVSVAPGRRVAVLVDCVLGLPHSEKLISSQLKDFFTKAASHEQSSTKKRGREMAAEFFDELLRCYYDPVKFNELRRFPRRLCEELTGSNSVFQKHPFQKNIQSGTFRIWRDLGTALMNTGRDHQDPIIWPHDPWNSSVDMVAPKATMAIAEGYPSFYWREVFGALSRKPEKLRELASRVFSARNLKIECDNWETLSKNPDAADAAVLAMSAFLMDLDQRLFPHFSVSTAKCRNQGKDYASIEGWIAGVSIDDTTLQSTLL